MGADRCDLRRPFGEHPTKAVVRWMCKSCCGMNPRSISCASISRVLFAAKPSARIRYSLFVQTVRSFRDPVRSHPLVTSNLLSDGRDIHSVANAPHIPHEDALGETVSAQTSDRKQKIRDQNSIP